MMNDNENMVSDAAAQDMELTDPQGSEPQSADAKNAQEASSADDFHRTGRMQLYVRRFRVKGQKVCPESRIFTD